MPAPRIGTSGWRHYKDWPGRFYPERLPSSEFLAYYARYFNTVELNGVFYRLPTPAAVRRWYAVTPKGFVFAYKASRFITHMKKLSEPREALKLMFSRADLLKEKLGPILFQLPPFFQKNTERLADFLSQLPRGYSYVMEFRHASWFCDAVYEQLEKRNVSLCLYDLKGNQSPQAFPSSLVYVRFHGTEDKYHGNYSDQALESWAAKIASWTKKKKAVYAYFNNDPQGHAIYNARSMKRMLGLKEEKWCSVQPISPTERKKN